MNKELLIAFIRKDLDELGVLLEGLSENAALPHAIINLAVSKAENIAGSLLQLPQAEQPAPAPVSECKQSANLPESEKSDSKENVFSIEDGLSISTESFEVVSIRQEPVKVEDKIPAPTEDLCSESEAAKNTPTSNEAKESRVVTVGASLATKISLNESIGKEEKTVGAALANKKIENLKQAISIADRFRFQRELFAGNGERMNQVLSELNNLDSFTAAISYIEANFQWGDQLSSVQDFMEIVNRKFLA